MNCDVFRILISGHMDGANSEIEEKRLQEHLKGCRSCRALLEEYERNDRLLSEVPSPPENLTGRIMREIVPRRKKKKAKYIYFTVPAAALATAALLAFAVFRTGALPGLSAKSADTAFSEEKQNSQLFSDVLDTNGASAATDEFLSFSQETLAEAETSAALETPQTSEAFWLQVPTDVNAPAEAGSTDNPPTVSVEPPEEVPYKSENSADIPDSIEPDLGNMSVTSEGPVSNAAVLPNSPILILWNAGNSEILEVLEPLPSAAEAENACGVQDYLHISPDSSKITLLDRFFSILCRHDGPYAEKNTVEYPYFGRYKAPAQRDPAFTVTVYEMSYSELTELFYACAGKYEMAIYYPAEGLDLSEAAVCTLLCVTVISSPARMETNNNIVIAS